MTLKILEFKGFYGGLELRGGVFKILGVEFKNRKMRNLPFKIHISRYRGPEFARNEQTRPQDSGEQAE